MTDTVVSYIFFLLIAILVILAFVIGNEKMIKVLLGNYILATLCLAANQSLDILIQFLITTPTLKILTFSYNDIATFITGGKTSIVLILYLILLFLMYQKSKIRITMPNDEILQKTFSLFLVPLTVISFILTLEIVILGMNSLNPASLETLARGFTSNYYIIQFIVLTPVWILLHGLATVLITSEIKMSIKTDI
ncbi:hypothetical protein P148_SR1C00001G1007 [candidate division SR1 bacterium RAAC1_SR1_1]|nr:hypothetical protein P148_SR1C00001G1007 [candidate division SR1 bacterium RAAC1_SR1_1]